MRQAIQVIKNALKTNRLVMQSYQSWRAKQGRDRLKRLSNTCPLRIVIGASGICDQGWIETNIEYLNLLNPQDWQTYFEADSIDALLAEHVWEHLTPDEALVAAQQCYQYLKVGGYLRVAVPDGFHPEEQYRDRVKPGGTGPGADDHKVLYNHMTFSSLFERAGFRVKLLEYFDSEGTFHFTDWDPEAGKIIRSSRFDKRNQAGKLNYTSIILDAYKDT